MNNLQTKDAMNKLIKLSKTDFFAKDIENNAEIKYAYEYTIRNIEYSLFDDTLSIALSKRNYFPKPADLKKAYAEAKLQRNQKIVEAKHTDNCTICENRGVIMYTKNGSDYAARCVCSRAQNYINAPAINQIINLDLVCKEAKSKNTTVQKLLLGRNYTNITDQEVNIG